VEIRALLLELTHQQGMTVFMSSHILAEVARLAGRVGILHQGRLLQELNLEELEQNRRKSLIVRVQEVETACLALKGAGLAVEVLPDGSLELKDEASLARPEAVNRLLVNAGSAPSHLVVEEEELEQYFLRLVGMQAGASDA
jgi:ABC-2 type transport system ATP-binding protein